MWQISFRAMGSHMKAMIDSDSPHAAAALEEVPRWFATWERCLSRFREDSELSRLNRSSGRSVRVSATLWKVLRAALLAAQLSDGLVVPTVLSALEAAGYDRSFEQVPERAVEEAMGERNTWPDAWRWIRLDPEQRTVRLPYGVRLDLGGIAKGWAADQAIRRLRPYGPALVDAGGDIAVSGPMASGQPWPIGVADPRADQRVPLRDPPLLGILRISCGGVATSGWDVRRWWRRGEEQHHLIDPRTGRPARTDVLTVTVVAPTAYEAEIAAKAVFLLGSREGLAWLERHPGMAGLIVRHDGELLWSSRWAMEPP
ncbi:FAD:protein FMN transferase [Candidatus Thermoflexus japonica]|uniref:FAD:protein FMN transferase n=1 Tax=Candidatus Thermoflexus japonica TaxID=2035417 RepID=A0A2H5Y4X9_9CHLR|nr:FAD:protein FMN transferase [Candidatus Thermoflexus japonica]